MSGYLVCMLNARHNDGRRGDAFIGNDLKFSTLDPQEAHSFDQFEAERYADHWRGWYRGFAGSVTIEVRPVDGLPESQARPVDETANSQVRV